MTQVNGFHSGMRLVKCISLGFFKLLKMLHFLAKKCYEMLCKYNCAMNCHFSYKFALCKFSFVQ